MSERVTAPAADQAQFWNAAGGRMWADTRPLVTGLIKTIGDAALERAALKPGEHVLDIGCGFGETTQAIARAVGPSGSVLGVDVSTLFLPTARAEAEAAGLSNTRFQLADAETAALDGAPFDLAFSRFGVMFFADPNAAFRNIAGALRPGARLVFCCWRGASENPFMVLPMAAAAPHLPPRAPPDPTAPGPLAFADPARVRAILAAAGFEAVEVDAFRWTMAPQPLEEMVEFARHVGPLAAALRDPAVAPTAWAHIGPAVAEALGAYRRADDLVHLPAAGWIAAARHP